MTRQHTDSLFWHGCELQSRIQRRRRWGGGSGWGKEANKWGLCSLQGVFLVQCVKPPPYWSHQSRPNTARAERCELPFSVRDLAPPHVTLLFRVEPIPKRHPRKGSACFCSGFDVIPSLHIFLHLLFLVPHQARLWSDVANRQNFRIIPCLLDFVVWRSQVLRLRTNKIKGKKKKKHVRVVSVSFWGSTTSQQQRINTILSVLREEKTEARQIRRLQIVT